MMTCSDYLLYPGYNTIVVLRLLRFLHSTRMAFLSDNLFQQMGAGISADPSLASKIKGVYLFVITGGPGGATKEWTIDLKTGAGSLTQGKGCFVSFFIFILEVYFLNRNQS